MKCSKLFILLTLISFSIYLNSTIKNSSSKSISSNLSELSTESLVVSTQVLPFQDQDNSININNDDYSSDCLSSITSQATVGSFDELKETIISIAPSSFESSNQNNDDVIIDMNNLRDIASDLSEPVIRYYWLLDLNDKDTINLNNQKLMDRLTTRGVQSRSKLIKNIKARLLERLNQAQEKEDTIETLKVVLEVLLQQDRNRQSQVNRNTLINIGGTMIGIGILAALTWILNNWGQINKC